MASIIKIIRGPATVNSLCKLLKTITINANVNSKNASISNERYYSSNFAYESNLTPLLFTVLLTP